LSFLTTPTVYSSLSLAGLLHPASSHGVRAVSPRASHRLLCSSRQSSRRSPDSPFTPYRVFPSSTAVLRHRSRCLLAVSSVPSLLPPSHRSGLTSRCPACDSHPAPVFPPAPSARHPSLNLEALLHVRVRCRAPCLHDSQPDTLLGFAPLQGSPFNRGVTFCGHPAQAPLPVKQASPSAAASQTVHRSTLPTAGSSEPASL